MLLNGLATAGVAFIAGAELSTVLRLGLAMTALQASIGALNDVVDAPTDAGSKPAKPIPRGYVSVGEGKVVATVAAVLGLALAALSGVATAVVAALILGVGYAYDLRGKGTAWSWLPFAAGIPLLPVFAWLGTHGTLPGAFGILIPSAIAAGAALAVANARADFERDAAAGVGSIAVSLGLDRAWLVSAALIGAVVALALATLMSRQPSTLSVAAAIGSSGMLIAGIGMGFRGNPMRRERAWELQAIGTALLAVAWLSGWGDLY